MTIEQNEGFIHAPSDVPDASDSADYTFLRSQWYAAGWASEFDAIHPTARLIIEEPLVLYRTSEGQLVALEDRCPHRWAPLSLGRIELDDLRCMYHGVKFARDGRCIEVPGQNVVPPSLAVRTYPVIERHGLAWVWMGLPDSVDPALIPDLGMLHEPQRRIYTGSLHYKAHYSLINANLLDLSHISFLHEKTLGRPVVTPSGSRPKFENRGGAGAISIERGVRTEVWTPHAGARSIVIPRNAPDGDLWSRVDFLVPGIYISRVQMHPLGTASECNGLPPAPERSPLSDVMSVQVVTPMTARETRYLYSFGPRAADMEKEESDAVWAVALEAFSEDLRMIQAQQRMMDHYPGRRMGGIASDRGAVLFKNLMRKLIAAESKSVLR